MAAAKTALLAFEGASGSTKLKKAAAGDVVVTEIDE
jgi:hypothetical protein